MTEHELFEKRTLESQYRDALEDSQDRVLNWSRKEQLLRIRYERIKKDFDLLHYDGPSKMVMHRLLVRAQTAEESVDKLTTSDHSWRHYYREMKNKWWLDSAKAFKAAYGHGYAEAFAIPCDCPKLKPKHHNVGTQYPEPIVVDDKRMFTHVLTKKAK